MDLYMPGCTGLELAAVIRQHREYLAVPIVFLSMESRLHQQMQAIGLGADDFLTKTISPQHLVATVAARAQRARELRGQMTRDGLTGLLNHTNLKERLEASGSSLDKVVWANWSLRDPTEFDAFNKEWVRWFPGDGPIGQSTLMPPLQRRVGFRVTIGVIAQA